VSSELPDDKKSHNKIGQYLSFIYHRLTTCLVTELCFGSIEKSWKWWSNEV